MLAAIAFAFSHLKLVVEPGGAVCLAALLAEWGYQTETAQDGEDALEKLAAGVTSVEEIRRAIANW